MTATAEENVVAGAAVRTDRPAPRRWCRSVATNDDLLTRSAFDQVITPTGTETCVPATPISVSSPG